MKRPTAMQNYQLQRFADFLDAHPTFSPILCGQDALVCGFLVGKCFLPLQDMERLLATPPDFRLASLVAAPATRNREP